MQEDGDESKIAIFTEDLSDPEYATYGDPITVNLFRKREKPIPFMILLPSPIWIVYQV